MSNPTKVVFLWHMHQPYYRLPSNRYYYLGWTRLHAVKDYFGMAYILEKFDKVKVVFNFSGVLLKQLIDYVYNDATDYYAMLTLKDPLSLSKKERDFIIDRFFSVNFERFVRPNPRYLQLYQKKVSKKKFSPQDILDLQVLFNLCWFHPYTVKKDKNLQDLISRGKNYTQEDKEYILCRQKDIMKEIFPLYKKLLKKGKIEITVTPFYHPILPLIYDTDILDEFGYFKKPRARFSYPSDVAWHLEKSKDIYRELFEKDVKGSWPSEGSISQDVACMYMKHNFEWIGLDEGILFKSLVTEYVSYDLIKNQRHLIYKPYRFGELNILFRDRNLSDAISFIYQGWEDPVFAACDLMEHFKRIHYYTKDMFKERVITIIMDGENAWEYYKNNGVEFLETVYTGLEKSEILTTDLPSNIFKHSSPKRLQKLASGSWINNDFGVWIGSKENNLCWDILKRLRDIAERKKSRLRNSNRIMEYIYILEGSDWNWWNTFEEPSGDFKKIYLSYVKETFKLLKEKIPDYVDRL